MKVSPARIAALAGLVGTTLMGLALTTAPQAVAEPGDWCAVSAAPCIVSVQRQGSVAMTADSATWQAELSVFNNESPDYTQLVYSLRHTGSLELPATELGVPWTIVIDTGTTIPRVVNRFGRNGTVTRTDDGGGTYHVTVTAEPTLVAFGCEPSPFPWPCPEHADSDEVRFSGTIDDWRAWEDPVQRAAFYGVNFFSNLDVTSFPPGVMYDDATGIAAMRLDVTAPHFRHGSDTLVNAHFEATLPNDFLHENFFIPSPATMTTSSLVVGGTGSGSTTTLSKPTPASPMFVEVTNMTFPTASVAPSTTKRALAATDDDHIRKLRVKTGTIVPTRPTDLRATRVTSTRAKIRYDLAKPRGARVTGYKARCESPGGHVASATKSGNTSPIYVGGLHRRTPYTCKVRALSNAGPGPWSVGAQVPRRP